MAQRFLVFTLTKWVSISPVTRPGRAQCGVNAPCAYESSIYQRPMPARTSYEVLVQTRSWKRWSDFDGKGDYLSLERLL